VQKTDKFSESIDRINNIIEVQKKKRQEEWALIRKETPTIAEFLIELNKVFGKPGAVIVKSHGKVIFKK